VMERTNYWGNASSSSPTWAGWSNARNVSATVERWEYQSPVDGTTDWALVRDRRGPDHV